MIVKEDALMIFVLAAGWTGSCFDISNAITAGDSINAMNRMMLTYLIFGTTANHCWTLDANGIWRKLFQEWRVQQQP